MNDPILLDFLKSAAEQARELVAESDVVHLIAHPDPLGPPSTFYGTFRGLDHFERTADGGIGRSASVIPFSVHFPADYLRTTDPTLQFRVLRTSSQLYHPNVRGGFVCLGSDFVPGTPLRQVVEQAFAIFSSTIHATQDPFDPDAALWYLRHGEEVEQLSSPPLRRRPLAARVEVRELAS